MFTSLRLQPQDLRSSSYQQTKILPKKRKKTATTTTMMTFGKPARFQLLTLSAVVINALLMIASARGQLYEGDPCSLSDGASGICKKATDCRWFVPRKTERKHCSWSEDRLTEVICCKTPEPIGVRSSLACERQPEHIYTVFHIIDGEEADPGEFPFMATLGFHSDADDGAGYDYRCGASLITRSFLLTAAHCFKQGKPLVALLGTVKLEPGEGVLVMIKKVHRHPNYNSKTKLNDIALIELDREVDITDEVNTICLYADTKDVPEGTQLKTEGFGIMDTDLGDPCSQKDGTPGSCEVSTKCPWFIENIIKKKRFGDRVTCGFDGQVEVICCNNSIPIGTRSSIACDRAPPIENRLTFHIIDGEEAEDGEFPFMAALGYESDEIPNGYDYRCGASMISDSFLLTAAHCIPTKSRPVVALLGTNDLAAVNPGVVVNIKEFYPHPKYRTSQSYNDIALIELERSVINEPNVSPICLFSSTKDLEESVTLTAEGYGIVDVDRQMRSQHLMKVNLTTVALDKCNQSFADNNLLKNNRKLPQGLIDTQYCATGRENTVTKQIGDTCQGDSGGPLQIVQDEKYKLIGVTSFGNGCGSNTPSVYTRVAAYIEWIESVVWGK